MDPDATAAASAGLLEPGAKELATRHLGRTAHNMSSSSLRKKSDLALLRKVPCAPLRRLLDNLQEVLLGTKLVLLFPAVILALAAHIFLFGRARGRGARPPRSRGLCAAGSPGTRDCTADDQQCRACAWIGI